MNKEFKIPDPETRARDIANLREACRQLDITNLMLDEAIAVADAHLLAQRRTRLSPKSNYIPTDRVES
jgi:glycine cleavage system pyridoxal-binding protein P